MKRLLLIACIAASCNNANNSTASADSANADSSATATEPAASASGTGTVALFDGTSLSKWHSYGESSAGANWTIDSGTIHQVPNKGGRDLVSNDAYSDFDLKLEWKISKDGNSGILFYVQDDTTKYEQTFYTGPEMQVLDNEGHPDGKIIKHRAGDLYDLITSKPETVKKVGEWNAVEIKSLKGQLTFWLNGTQVVQTTMWDDNWKKMIAGSKFKEWPEFGTFKTGHIVLQNHGNDVWYRNITIQKL